MGGQRLMTRRLGFSALWGAASLLLTGCTLAPDADHDSAEAPRPGLLTAPPRVAWVFSSGGPRGFVHVGVIRALDELGLRPDLIVGASAGALVGVLRASGLSGAQLHEMALDLRPWALGRLAFGAQERFSILGLAQWVREHTGARPLEALAPLVACVAHRPARGDVVAFTAGDSGLAVAASCAIQGQFAPVRIRGERYVDPDLHQPMPVRVARALGARRVLAIDASADERRAPPGTERWRAADLRKRELTQPDARAADLVLRPEFGYYAGLSREWRERVIEAGYRETLAAAASLRALHAA